MKKRDYNKWLQQVLQKEELTAQEMEQILDGQLRLPARAMDAALIRRCRLALYPNLQGAGVPGKRETLDRVHAFLQKEGSKEDSNANGFSKAKKRFFLRPAALATCVLFCMILFNVSNDAVGFNVWNLLFSWNDETMKMKLDLQAKLSNNVNYLNHTQTDDFFQKLEELEITPLMPSWMPDGFSLDRVESKIETEYLRWAVGTYTCGDRQFRISAEKDISGNLESTRSVEKDKREPDIYEQGGIKFYIMDNLGRSSVIWFDPPYIISISGHVTREELRHMIDSIFERSISK